MKLYAIILTASFLAFVGETVKIPVSCCDVKSAVCSSAEKKMSGCDKCSLHHKKKTRHDDGKTKNCVDCPLCAVMVVAKTGLYSSPVKYSVSEYSITPIDPLSDWHQQKWKPPDFFSFS
jgi:hypothetical protein